MTEFLTKVGQEAHRLGITTSTAAVAVGFGVLRGAVAVVVFRVFTTKKKRR